MYGGFDGDNGGKKFNSKSNNFDSSSSPRGAMD